MHSCAMKCLERESVLYGFSHVLSQSIHIVSCECNPLSSKLLVNLFQKFQVTHVLDVQSFLRAKVRLCMLSRVKHKSV